MSSSNYYLKHSEKKIDQFDDEYISSMYDQGFLFGRIDKGYMYQTRSLRINLSNFEFNSENRRILRKTEELQKKVVSLPIQPEDYDWKIHKLGKDFYSEKFGENTMSASKIKEMATDENKSNFNLLIEYSINDEVIGYCICYTNNDLLHYSYPFYNLNYANKNLGMGMMLMAIEWAISEGKKFAYLGSVVTRESRYKLQFNNLEWWKKERWNNDMDQLKEILEQNSK